MAIMSNIRTSTFRRVRTVSVSQSPFSGKVYRSGLQDWRWQFAFTYAPLSRVAALPLLAEIAAQAEGFGQFPVYDPDFGMSPTGYSGAMPVCAAAAVGSTAVPITGGTASAFYARAGEIVFLFLTGINGTMFRLTSDVTFTAGGTATLQLDAPIRVAAVAGDPVKLNPAYDINVRIQARLTGHSESTDAAGIYTITVSGEEIV